MVKFASIILASLFGCSKFATIAGINITNVVMTPLICPVNCWVGEKLAGFSKSTDWSELFDYSSMIALMKQSPIILVGLLVVLKPSALHPDTTATIETLTCFCFFSHRGKIQATRYAGDL